MLILSLHSLRSPAVVIEGLDNALSESGIPSVDLANALPTRSQRRRPAPAPPGGVTKARQSAPGRRKARQRAVAIGQPLKRIGKACANCRYVLDSIPQDNIELILSVLDVSRRSVTASNPAADGVTRRCRSYPAVTTARRRSSPT